MPRQFKVLNDLRAQDAHHVGEHRILESGEKLFGNGRPADNLPLFKHQHFEAGARQIGRVDQPVVAGADHDDIVAACHLPRSVNIANERGLRALFRKLMRISDIRSACSISRPLVSWIVKGFARNTRWHARTLIFNRHFELYGLAQVRITSLKRGQCQVGFQHR